MSPREKNCIMLCFIGKNRCTFSGGSTVSGFFHTMRKQFTTYEWQSIKNQSTEWRQLAMFYRHWVWLNAKYHNQSQCGRSGEWLHCLWSALLSKSVLVEWSFYNLYAPSRMKCIPQWTLTLSLLTLCLESKIDKFSTITNWLKLKNKSNRSKVLLNSFPY